MIQLSNGHKLEYVVASGALAFDGQGWPWEKPLVKFGLIKPELFTVVIKSLTLDPRVGNLKMWKPWECVRLIPGGAVNKIGLTNPGINWWFDKVAKGIDFEKFSIIGSIFGEEEDLIKMAIKFRVRGVKIKALEINVSCPNSGHAMEQAEKIIEIVKRLKKILPVPIILKLSVSQDYLTIAKALVGIVEAISLNSVPWETVFPGKQSPLWKLEKKVGGGGGGVSGIPAQAFNWPAVKALADLGSIPVIAPDIMNFEDMIEVRKLGAKAVSFGTIHLFDPTKPTTFVQKEKYEIHPS